MPLRLPDKLPAIELLKKENIFVMDNSRATTQDIRPLRIVILNLMPLKITTETDLIRLLSNTPLQLDISFMKAAALVSYEKESPDMALVYLGSLVDSYYADRDAEWRFDGQKADDAFFEGAIQEYCYTFFNIGSRSSYSAFFRLSEKMLGYYPDAVVFMDNMGSYYLVAEEDYKTAQKYYSKVLKKVPDDYTAIKNSVLIARKQKNTKMEKKYLEKLAGISTGQEKLAAEARLKFLQQ